MTRAGPWRRGRSVGRAETGTSQAAAGAGETGRARGRRHGACTCAWRLSGSLRSLARSSSGGRMLAHRLAWLVVLLAGCAAASREEEAATDHSHDTTAEVDDHSVEATDMDSAAWAAA